MFFLFHLFNLSSLVKANQQEIKNDQWLYELIGIPHFWLSVTLEELVFSEEGPFIGVIVEIHFRLKLVDEPGEDQLIPFCVGRLNGEWGGLEHVHTT